MQVATQPNRSIASKLEGLWSGADNTDRLVFVVTVVCGVISFFLPWGGQ